MADNRSEQAQTRGRSAGDRATELHRLQERLDQGEHLTDGDVAEAQVHRDEALRHAGEAHRWAALARERSAKAHRAAAQQAAAVGDEEVAARHRAAAEVDSAAAEESGERG